MRYKVIQKSLKHTLGAKKRALWHRTAILKIDNLSYYGPIMAIRGVSLEVRQGQIVTVLGANGAGKTTLLKTISGIMIPKKGLFR